MISAGRIPLNEAEHKAAEKLAAEHGKPSMSLTRRDPGESGPLLVHIGDATYQIDDTGRRRKVT